MMELKDRLTKAHSDAANLYLQRQQVQTQLQQMQAHAAEIDRALLRSDGVVELLETLIKESESTRG